MSPTPEKLYEAANRAAADAIHYRRQPGGETLASIRERDARAMRALAREAARAGG